jgi:hypothetical protein
VKEDLLATTRTPSDREPLHRLPHRCASSDLPELHRLATIGRHRGHLIPT